jgi:hypothetical protein
MVQEKNRLTCVFFTQVDLFRLIDWDGDQFARMAEQIMMRHTRHDGSSSLLRRLPAAVDDDASGTGGSDEIGDAIDNDDGRASSGARATIDEGDGGNSEIGGEKISVA